MTKQCQPEKENKKGIMDKHIIKNVFVSYECLLKEYKAWGIDITKTK